MVDQPQKLSAQHNCNVSVSKLTKVIQFSQWFVHNKVIVKLSQHVAKSSNSKHLFVTNGVNYYECGVFDCV